MIATAIRAYMMAYSTEVAPDESFTNDMNVFMLSFPCDNERASPILAWEMPKFMH